jgi:PAS domain S-box-containing protein
MDTSERTVLIVDDSPEDRYTYRRYLLQDRSQQYTILEAETGQAALELCQHTQPDLILLDFLLPDLTGLELLPQLQVHFQEAVLPIILLTGQGSEAIAVQAMKAGVQDYLVKGQIKPKDLRHAIESVIEKSKLRIQLRESEERLKLALEATQMGIWEWHIQSNTVIWSEQVGPLFGLPLGATIPTYEAFLDLVHPDDRMHVSQAILGALQEKNGYEIELRTRWADGTIRWIVGRGQIYCDAINQPLRLVGTVMDITKSKQAETERLQRIERERLIAQMAQQVHRSLNVNDVLQTTVDEVRQFLQTDRVLIFRLNSETDDGTVVTESVGAEWTALLSTNIYDPCFSGRYIERYQQGRFMTTTDIHTAGLEPCHFDLLAGLQVRANLVVPILQDHKLWGLLIAHHCAAPRDWQPLEVDLLKQLATQTGIALQQAELYQQAQNQLAERTFAEEALRYQTDRERLVSQIAQRIRQTLDLAEVLNKTVEEVQQFLKCDRAFIYRLNPDYSGVIEVESVKAGWTSLLAEVVEDTYFVKTQGEDYRQGRIQVTEDIYTAGLTDCHVELLARFQVRANLAVPILQGEKLWGLLVANQCADVRSWHPLEIDLLRQLATQVGIAIQQSEYYQRSQIAREQAEQANRVKDEFLAILSHELRTPLNPILGWSKMLRAGRLNPEKTKEALLTIERNAKLQSQLIEDLLDVSRILRGKLALQITSVDLVTTIQAALETVRLAAEAKQINIQTVFDQMALFVTGDAGRLQQVAWNLLSNAVKFTPQQGQVQVHLGQIDSMAQIQVIDTGKGISPEFLPHVFDYFRQEDSAITRQFGGLGLGLAIVRQIVELHGGTVAVESLGDNQGATFTVRLPLPKPEAIKQPDLNSTAMMGAEPTESLVGLKVLVVDDDVDSREFVAFVLEQDGAQVKTVRSALDALQVLAEWQPNVLVSDVGMPDIDGYAFVRQVRMWTPEQGGQIPAIALTAYAGEYDQKQAIEAGFQQHLSKPVDPSELVHTVARLGHGNSR